MKNVMDKIMFPITGLLMLGALFLSLQAHAVFRPNWERPIASADMEKIQSSGHFEASTGVELTLTKRDGQASPTGITLKYNLCEYCPAFATENLEIYDIEEECGSLIYTAHLPETSETPRLTGAIQTTYFDVHRMVENQDDDTQRRFTIMLTDHRSRVCKDHKPYLWEASVQDAFIIGGDAIKVTGYMELVGNPEIVYTIQ